MKGHESILKSPDSRNQTEKTEFPEKEGFRILEHANGTRTLVDATNGQAMHSRIGPEAEARMVYAAQARIEHALHAPEQIRILYDVGMGTGANVISVLEAIRNRPTAAGRLEIFSFESCPDGLKTALESPADFPFLVPWMKPLQALLASKNAAFEIGSVSIHWNLITGDFFRNFQSLPPPDSIFYDFYSPAVVPELWSRPRFESLRAHIGDHACVLATYSAATPVRLGLLLAGFFVGEGVSTGMKHETTLASTRLELLEYPLRESWLTKLETSSSIRDFPNKREVLTHPQWENARLKTAPVYSD